MSKVFLKNGVRDDSVMPGLYIFKEDDGSEYSVTFKDEEGGIRFIVSEEQYEKINSCDSYIKITVKERPSDYRTLGIDRPNSIIIEDIGNLPEARMIYDMTLSW